MRVRFFQPTNEEETAQFLTVERKIAGWWSQFRAVQHRSPTEWLGSLRRELREIDPNLGLEVESETGERRLFILALEGLAELPLARKVADLAGETLGWQVATQRMALPLEPALSYVFGATRFDLRAARVKLGIDRGHALSIVVGHYLFQGTGDELGGRAAELLVSTLLGDATFDRWVSSVEVVSAPRPSPLKLVGQQDAALPLPVEELAETVTTAIARITDTLPEAPLHAFCERADWVLFEMDEDGTEATDYPLPDLKVATTMCPEMLKSFLTGVPFASERFSRHGEVFAFVQIDTRGQSQNQSLEQRTGLEEALDYGLVPGRLGCVVGAGVGETYMYVFLAMHQVDAALKLLLRYVREHRLPKRTWVRFCDDEWRNEWLGAYEDTPLLSDDA